MKLLTQELLRQFATTGSQEEVADPIVICKFFDPCSQRTWFATEYNPEEKMFFGLVEGIEKELGYFSLQELEDYKGPLGIGIERDMCFTRCTISQVGKH